MKKHYHWLILLLLLAVGAFLRFSGSISIRDFWYDEAFTGILLKQSWPQMNQMIFADVHPPLYYWLAKPWAGMFDFSPFGIRSFSAVLGIVTIFSVFWVSNRIFGKKTAILAAAITAFSPFAIEYSQEARMYALFGLLMLWAAWFFYKAVIAEKNGIPSKKNWIAWGVFAGLSFFTHYLSLFFFVMFYIAYALVQKSKIKNQNYNLKFKIKNIFFGSKGFWLGAGVIVVFFASWLKIFIRHISKGNLGWIDASQLSDIPKTLQIFFFGHPAGTGGVPWPNEFRFFFDSTSAGLIIFSAMLVFITVIFMRMRYKKAVAEEQAVPDYFYALVIFAVLSFGTLIFLILLSHINIKLYVARYFMPAAIFIYILFSALAVKTFSSKFTPYVALAIYLGMIMLLKPPVIATGWNTIYQSQEKTLGCCDLVVTSNPFDYTTARFYFGKDRVRYYNKSNPTEDFSGWVVVGNENRITDLETIKNNHSMVVVDGDCAWEGLDVESKMTVDQLSVCKLRR